MSVPQPQPYIPPVSLVFNPGIPGIKGVEPYLTGLNELHAFTQKMSNTINGLLRSGAIVMTGSGQFKVVDVALAAVVAGITAPVAVTGAHNSSCTLTADDTWMDDAGGGFTLATAGKYLFVTTCYSSITLDATASTGSQGAIQCRYKNGTGPTFSDPGTVGWINGLVKAVEWRSPGAVYSKVLTVAAGDVITPQFNRKTDNNGTATVYSAAAILNDATKGVSITEYTRLGS